MANNSSGMACGTVANSYRTLESITFVLPSGTVVDTAAPEADLLLRAREPALYEGIVRLRDRVRGNADSVRRITAQFAMKNTMGYGLNSFLDHTGPVDILTHLMIGSEGTLAFIGSAVYPHGAGAPQASAPGCWCSPTCAARPPRCPAWSPPGWPPRNCWTPGRCASARPTRRSERLRRIQVDRHAALLRGLPARLPEELDQQCAAAAPTLDDLPLALPFELTADPGVRAALWHVRKGLYATIAGARPSGTTALLEDIVVPVPELLPTCESLGDLFHRHDYADSVIFGHAKDGNIHFMLTERLGGGSRWTGSWRSPTTWPISFSPTAVR